MEAEMNASWKKVWDKTARILDSICCCEMRVGSLNSMKKLKMHFGHGAAPVNVDPG